MFKRLREFYSSITTIDVLNFIVCAAIWSIGLVMFLGIVIPVIKLDMQEPTIEARKSLTNL